MNPFSLSITAWRMSKAITQKNYLEIWNQQLEIFETDCYPKCLLA